MDDLTEYPDVVTTWKGSGDSMRWSPELDADLPAPARARAPFAPVPVAKAAADPVEEDRDLLDGYSCACCPDRRTRWARAWVAVVEAWMNRPRWMLNHKGWR